MKQNAKTVLVQLATPINAHQNANKKPIGSAIGSAPAYQAQCTLPPYPIYQTLAPFGFIEGLILETNQELERFHCATCLLLSNNI